MPLTDDQRRHVRSIDAYVRELFARGGDEAALIRTMSPYLPAFKALLDSTSPQEMTALCGQFEGLQAFTSVVERISKGINDGTISVPDDASTDDDACTPDNNRYDVATVTVNGAFIAEFLGQPAPCFALGFAEQRQQRYGFLAVHLPEALPVTHQRAGFRLGQAVLGNDSSPVVLLSFDFKGAGVYNVLLNPQNAVVQAVLTHLMTEKTALICTFDHDHQISLFGTTAEQDVFAQLRRYQDVLAQAGTTAFHYEHALQRFVEQPTPAGLLLNWVCREGTAALDLVNNRLEVEPVE